MSDRTYWIYILHCENAMYYTGYTSDIQRRYSEHAKGTAKCKFTRSFKPLALAQSWEVDSKSMAMRIENFIKRLTKKEKEELILNPGKLTEHFSCEVGMKGNTSD